MSTPDPRGVTLGLNVVPLHLDVNAEQSTLNSHVWFVMRWTDTRLQWAATNYENISTVHLAPDKVWHPDIMVYNSVQHFDYEITDLLVTSGGTVRLRIRLILDVVGNKRKTLLLGLIS